MIVIGLDLRAMKLSWLDTQRISVLGHDGTAFSQFIP